MRVEGESALPGTSEALYPAGEQSSFLPSWIRLDLNDDLCAVFKYIHKKKPRVHSCVN